MSQRGRRNLLLAGGAASLAAAGLWGLAEPRSFFVAYLFAFVFWSALPLGAAAILMLHLLTGGRWGWSLRAAIEPAVRTVPLLWLLFLPLAFGLPQLYAWAQPGGASGPTLPGGARYLAPGFFLARAALYLAVWTALALALGRAARRQRSVATDAGAQGLAAAGMIAYFVSASFAALDWIGSLLPVWYSSIFPAYVVLGQALTWLAVAVLLAAGPRRGDDGPAPPSERVRLDLGNLLLTLVVLHAYVGFSQFLIIWNGDKPHEIAWYLPRIRDGWQWLTLLLAVGHFVLPFAALLVRSTKSDPARLRRVALLILAARLLDDLWLVAPGNPGTSFALAPLAILVLAGIGGLWTAAYLGGRREALP